jgi:DNA gyrase/topoisomerase IV subunit A
MRVKEQKRHSVQLGHQAHVRENHEIVLQSRDGVVIRMRADGISRYGRATQGVKVMSMREGDVVGAIDHVGRARRCDRGPRDCTCVGGVRACG